MAFSLNDTIAKILRWAQQDPLGEYGKYLSKEPETKSPEEWGLGGVQPILRLGDKGEAVREFQRWLEELGYELTRFGVDGDLGSETLSETRQFQDDHGLTLEEDCLKIRGVGPKTYSAVRDAPRKPKAEPLAASPYPVMLLKGRVPLYDITSQHLGKKRQGKRKWRDVRGITLHQTATNFGVDPMRYANVSAHMAIPTDGKVVLMNHLTDLVWHGNGFNRLDVGIEIDGHFAGIEGDLSTYWRPASRPDRMPMTLSGMQIQGALAAVDWVIETVARNGGKVEYIHAHRQSSKLRASDPGSKVWKEIGMVAQERWNLKDGGPDFSLNGYTIPKEWNPLYTRRYRQW